ncbi:arginine--tRNA ligase [Herpetosiphon llansteffanensis]
MDTFARFEQAIRDALLDTTLITADLIDLVAPKATGVQADLALPCFRAAKMRGSNPAQFAQTLANALKFTHESLVLKATALGAYVNFSLNPITFAQSVLHDIGQGKAAYGRSNRGQQQAVVVDYSSPNIAKRMRVDHIRSTMIGQAIVNIYRALGYQVIRMNHWGDYDPQLGISLAAMQHFQHRNGNGESMLASLEQQAQQYQADDQVHDLAQAWASKLASGEPQAITLLQQLVDLSLSANQANYRRLGVAFDVQHCESFYAREAQVVIKEALHYQIAQLDSHVAIVKDLLDEQGKALPTLLLNRSDGSTLYITRDIAAIKYREALYQPSKIIYVVKQAQELHFRQAFTISKTLGYTKADLAHVACGMILGPEGRANPHPRFSTTIYLEPLLDEACARAKTLLKQKAIEAKTAFTSEWLNEVAEQVGVGAVIYHNLQHDPAHDVVVDWDRMLAFDGNSAAYIQYMHARCCSILRDFGRLPQNYNGRELTHPAEQALLKELARLPQVIVDAAERYAPSVVADWLYATAKAFAIFYDACPVLKAETLALRAARGQLVAATAQALRNGLGLLSIAAPERM